MALNPSVTHVALSPAHTLRSLFSLPATFDGPDEFADEVLWTLTFPEDDFILYQTDGVALYCPGTFSLGDDAALYFFFDDTLIGSFSGTQLNSSTSYAFLEFDLGSYASSLYGDVAPVRSITFYLYGTVPADYALSCQVWLTDASNNPLYQAVSAPSTTVVAAGAIVGLGIGMIVGKLLFGRKNRLVLL
eukprot:gnl/Ergobibamus_cyprinoides/1970.p1 GENE.gnl/Ergobibamus_cyprinoides/1970~~gnl/Ergobibamus_cyprinoides/1970.p1  ORF type:complete len:189 (+),score=57.60 gnl/Ergobibamus_cyprinoides/1970:131-697(+)